MSRTVSLVQRIEIASPCPVSWDSMTGDDQVRFCGQCQLNVYNFAEMSAEEGERLILEKEGKLCARIYRRRDGTILTRDCPVGLAALRRRVMGLGVGIAASLFVIVGTAVSSMVGQRNRYDIFAFDQPRGVYCQVREKLWAWTIGASAPTVMAGAMIPLPPSTPNQ